MSEMKVCTVCKIEKNVTEFPKEGNGYLYMCKDCKNAKQRAWREKAAEHIKEYNAKNHERIYETKRASYLRNKPEPGPKKPRKKKEKVALSWEGTKVCIRCNQELPKTSFKEQPKNSDGLKNICKECISKKPRKIQLKTEAQVEKGNAIGRENARKNKERNANGIDWSGTKTCARCKETKNKTEFNKQLSKKDGLRSFCKDCRVQERKENREEIATRDRRYSKNNREKINAGVRKYCKIRRKQDPVWRLSLIIRIRLHHALKRGGFSKKESTEAILGCGFAYFMEYVGERPTEDAQLDHICPCAQAKDEEEILKLSHYTNFRWLSKEENMKKSANKTPEAEEMCKKLLGRGWINWPKRRSSRVDTTQKLD